MIISISGLIGSGKDTVAAYLVKEHNFIQLSFASSLKDTLSAIFGWDREMLEGKTEEHRVTRNIVDKWWSEKLGIENFTPRLALTMIGTDILRKHFNNDIWINSLLKKINELPPSTNIVISDARYRNELNVLRELGSTLVTIERGKKPIWFESALEYNKACKLKKKFIRYMSSINTKPDMFNCNVHSSEYDWVGYSFDHTLYNISSIEDLLISSNNMLSLLSLAKSNDQLID